MGPAKLYRKTEKRGVVCLLCPHRCQIDEGKTGICGVRQNLNGELFSLTIDSVAAVNMDPIEKKPLYHFLPGTLSYSIGTMGCNFRCSFCQNHSLSQLEEQGQVYGTAHSPGDIVEAALRGGARSISFTYSEPTVFFELMLETAELAHRSGLKNVMVSNGYLSKEALNQLAPFMDAANIDLKSFSDKFYRSFCGARLQPVLDTITRMIEHNIWLELTTLLIPGQNDSRDEIEALTDYIITLNPNIPWHLSRYFPQYRYQASPPTDPEMISRYLEKAVEKGLKYAYAGNLRNGRWETTSCPECETTLINRSGYSTRIKQLIAGNCGHCQRPIPGVW